MTGLSLRNCTEVWIGVQKRKEQQCVKIEMLPCKNMLQIEGRGRGFQDISCSRGQVDHHADDFTINDHGGVAAPGNANVARVSKPGTRYNPLFLFWKRNLVEPGIRIPGCIFTIKKGKDPIEEFFPFLRMSCV